MDLTIEQCLNIGTSLNELSLSYDNEGNIIRDKDGKPVKSDKILPSKFSFRIGFISDEIDPVVKRYQKVIQELFVKYGERQPKKDAEGNVEKDKDGNDIMTDMYMVKAENTKEFNDEVKALNEEKVSLNIKPLDESIFDGMKISIQFVRNFKPLIAQN